MENIGNTLTINQKILPSTSIKKLKLNMDTPLRSPKIIHVNIVIFKSTHCTQNSRVKAICCMSVQGGSSRNGLHQVSWSLSIEAQVAPVARSAFYQHWQVRYLWLFLNRDNLTTVVHALVTSRLDYCSVLHMVLPLVASAGPEASSSAECCG